MSRESLANGGDADLLGLITALLDSADDLDDENLVVVGKQELRRLRQRVYHLTGQLYGNIEDNHHERN